MQDLFASVSTMAPIKMEDADVSFLVHFPMDRTDDAIFHNLYSTTNWLHEEVLVWGKRHLQPRLTAWFGDSGRSYTYSGVSMEPAPWTDVLLVMKRRLEEFVETKFNSVLLNLYRDNNDSMGFHSDNEPSLGKQPTIASLSYGDTRTLIFKHKKRADLPTKHVPLTSGSLLLMKGETQRHWKHGINKESDRCGARINLTFRNILH